MKILILGGTGFVGSHVARAFRQAGHEVAVAVRPSSRRDLVEDVEPEWVEADLHQPQSLVRACEGRDVVCHLAGVLSLWEKDKELLYQTNVLGTRNLVAACLEAGVGRLIYDGSVGIYAGRTVPEPVDERGAPDTSRFHSFHVTSMCLAEREILEGCAQGLDVVRLHPPLCLGEGDRNLHSSWPILGLSTLGVSVCPPGGLCLAVVEDVAQAHVKAASDAPKNANYLLGGENLTNRAFLDLLNEVLDTGGFSLPVGRFGMATLGRAAELVQRLRGEDQGLYVSLNENLADSMSLYWWVDDSKAQQELGYVHSPIRPALEQQIAWLRAEGILPEGRDLRAFAERFLRAPR